MDKFDMLSNTLQLPRSVIENCALKIQLKTRTRINDVIDIIVEMSGKVPGSKVTIELYSDKSWVVRGNFTLDDSENYDMVLVSDIVNMGGTYNENLKGGPGWIFPLYKGELVKNYLRTGKIVKRNPHNYLSCDSVRTVFFSKLDNGAKYTYEEIRNMCMETLFNSECNSYYLLYFYETWGKDNKEAVGYSVKAIYDLILVDHIEQIEQDEIITKIYNDKIQTFYVGMGNRKKLEEYRNKIREEKSLAPYMFESEFTKDGLLLMSHYQNVD